MTTKEAAQEWVNGFNAIQQSMIKKLMRFEPDDWSEITKPAGGSRAHVYAERCDGVIVECGKHKFRIKLDSGGKKIWVEPRDFEIKFDERLPMWGTMWSFSHPCDICWLENGDGIEIMSRYGFRIYASAEFGLFFGIDGAGYDFYEKHWIPLYKARGLKWHER